MNALEKYNNAMSITSMASIENARTIIDTSVQRIKLLNFYFEEHPVSKNWEYIEAKNSIDNLTQEINKINNILSLLDNQDTEKITGIPVLNIEVKNTWTNVNKVDTNLNVNF